MRTTLSCVLLVLGVFWAVQVNVLRGQRDDARLAIRDTEISLSNAIARNDITRQDGDQWRRLVQQLEIERDDLARSYDERVAAEVGVVIDPAPVAEVVLSAEPGVPNFYLHEDDFIEIAIEIDLTSSLAKVGYNLKPLSLTVGIRCGPPNDHDIRSVVATVETDPPVPVRITNPRADPEVCNPTTPRAHGFWDKAKGLAQGAAIAALVILVL